MNTTLKMCALALLLALSACAAPQVRYQPTPKPQIPGLPPDLAQKQDPAKLCRELLSIFSASPQALQESCGNETP